MSIKITSNIIQLKSETIDRLDSVVSDLPKYKKNLEALIRNFSIDSALRLMHVIDKDHEFKASMHNGRYNEYFDEIEELIYIITGTGKGKGQ
jgi:hypothetical protein